MRTTIRGGTDWELRSESGDLWDVGGVPSLVSGMFGDGRSWTATLSLCIWQSFFCSLVPTAGVCDHLRYFVTTSHTRGLSSSVLNLSQVFRLRSWVRVGRLSLDPTPVSKAACKFKLLVSLFPTLLIPPSLRKI